jgi:hypothetical protein
MATVSTAPGPIADTDMENNSPEKGLSNEGADGPVKYDSDNSSNFKQQGVKVAEAITSVWTSKVMWITFGL